MTVSTPAISVEECLGTLLEGDLAFTNGNKRHLLHSFHAFAARFPPDLPRYFIEGLSKSGETVLDPMAGSGSTIVEAWRLSRNALGVDLDPLAIRLCEVKTSWIEPEAITRSGQKIITTAYLRSKMANPAEDFLRRVGKATLEFIDYWFTPKPESTEGHRWTA